MLDLATEGEEDDDDDSDHTVCGMHPCDTRAACRC
jgi:hypothetical protein